MPEKGVSKPDYRVLHREALWLAEEASRFEGSPISAEAVRLAEQAFSLVPSYRRGARSFFGLDAVRIAQKTGNNSEVLRVGQSVLNVLGEQGVPQIVRRIEEIMDSARVVSS